MDGVKSFQLSAISFQLLRNRAQGASLVPGAGLPFESCGSALSGTG
jgi:hypothetical protein